MSYRRTHIKSKIHRIKPKKSIFLRPIFWILFFSAVLVSIILYCLVFLQNFWVSSIMISGNEKASEQDIKNIVSSEINKEILDFLDFSLITKSIFFVNPNNIEHKILDEIPVVGQIIVKKKFPQSIIVQLEERKPLAVLCSQSNDSCFYIDKMGVAFEELQNNSEGLPSVRLESGIGDIFPGKEVIEKNIVSAISQIFKNFEETLQIKIEEAFVVSSERINIKTFESWQAYFDLGLNSDINLQLTKLNLLLSEEISNEDRANLQYIDLRFDRAYYK